MGILKNRNNIKMDALLKIYKTLMLFAVVEMAQGHGYIARPAARNALWKYGFDNPPNYDLMSLNAGGPAKVSSGGHSKCGDNHDGPFDHMAGGRYANGIIAQTYTEGQTIDIEIIITAH